MKRFKKLQMHYFIMTLPALIWLILFSVVPMVGIIMAFQRFNPGKGIFGSPFAGLENFRYLFQLNDSRQVIINTFVIAMGKIILHLVFPLLFALMLNEVKNMAYKKFVQTVAYLPHFLSWVIMSGIVLGMFGYVGVINTVASWFGAEPKLWMNDPGFFRKLIVGTDVWKEFGYNAVIYLAALTGIDMALYEAAAVDGATRIKQIRHITLPGITPTIVLLGVLSLGSVLNAGFDQVFNLYNPLVYSTGDIIDTWVYRIGLLDLQYSLATAAGLFKSVVSFFMIVASYILAYKFADYKVF